MCTKHVSIKSVSLKEYHIVESYHGKLRTVITRVLVLVGNDCHDLRQLEISVTIQENKMSSCIQPHSLFYQDWFLAQADTGFNTIPETFMFIHSIKWFLDIFREAKYLAIRFQSHVLITFCCF